MAYDAITIDTQVVYANARSLDSGLVGQLTQFKDGPAQVVLTEVVARELQKMLEERANAPIEALAKAIKQGEANGQFSADQLAVLNETQAALASPAEHAAEQLKQFVSDTGAEIIPAERATMKDILSNYFGKKPPFSTKGKKDEFPDAISLLALESWAQEHDKKILAVSRDGDWKAFADLSDHIDVVDDLGHAISTIVDAADALVAEAILVSQQIVDEEPVELEAAFKQKLFDEVESLSMYAELETSMPAEEEDLTLTLQSYELNPLGDEESIEIVQIGHDSFVMRAPIEVTAKASAEINFSIKDSIDRDYVSIGGTYVEREVTFDASVLITCTRSVDDDDPEQIDYEIDDAELVDVPLSVDLGYVEYSMAEDDPCFDLDEVREPDQE